jgi:hypothetical protein
MVFLLTRDLCSWKLNRLKDLQAILIVITDQRYTTQPLPLFGWERMQQFVTD